MRVSVPLAVILGLWAAACAEPEEEDLGTFMCGDVECDVRSEVCSTNEPCDGSPAPPPVCSPVPDACDGTASSDCLDSGCSQGEEGGFWCGGPVCG